jgi:hypothetical protein
MTMRDQRGLQMQISRIRYKCSLSMAALPIRHTVADPPH